MKHFILGLITGCLLLGATTFYIYNDGKTRLESANVRIAQLEQAKTKPATSLTDTVEKDISTLAAELRNKRLESLSKAQDDDFNRNYVQIVNTITSESSTLAIEARKRSKAPDVRMLADSIYTESTNLQSRLSPFRSKYSLID